MICSAPVTAPKNLLGLETVRTLNAGSIEGFYKADDDAATAQRMEHGQ